MMNSKKINYLLLFILISCSCNKSSIQAQEQYRGGKKHPQPTVTVFPNAADNYDSNAMLSGSLKDDLDNTTNELITTTGMPGLSAAMLVPGKGLWQYNKGDAETVFYWASVGKLITATLIEQLIQEQKITYNSRLSEWFPQLQDARKINIGQLLTHTSGIYSFNNDPKDFLTDRYYTPEELIKLSAAKKNLFPPGSYWAYSNTGYLLLALIAEKIEGKPFDQILQQRIALPLKLSSLRALKPNELPTNLAMAHEGGKIVKQNYSVPLGAGNVISNARDMVVLLYSLMTGKLGTVPLVHDRLRDLYPMPDTGTWYGRGIMLFDFNEINHTDNFWIGHNGGTETYRALLVYDTSTRTFIALAINQHISVEAVALKLLSKIR